jgi:hypothetical protein
MLSREVCDSCKVLFCLKVACQEHEIHYCNCAACTDSTTQASSHEKQLLLSIFYKNVWHPAVPQGSYMITAKYGVTI